MISDSAIGGAIQRKMRGRDVERAGKGITLVISSEHMDNITRIIKSRENSAALIDGISKTVKHEIKRQKGGFLGMLLGTLGASMLGNMLAGKGIKRSGKWVIWIKFLVLFYPLSNIEITKSFNYKPRFNSVYSKNNLPRIKDRVYVINLHDNQSKGTHWVSLFIDRNTAVYFDSVGTEYIPQDVLNKIKDQSITHNIFRIQSNDSVGCRFYCIAFIEYLQEN